MSQLLTRLEWEARRDAHRAAVEDVLGDYLRRRAVGETHPVTDFLFTYYSHRPAQLLRWHPGYGLTLADADEYAGYSGYRRTADGVTADPELLTKRRDTIDYTVRLLRATAARPAQLACFGLHEWAMVYRSSDVRHSTVPLRLGSAGTDEVVESLRLRCTHYDAYRFFTPDAEPRNSTALSRDDQIRREQPGCVHAAMDLYKYCYKLAPLIDSALTLRCFRLAHRARELDMRASPYDLAGYGYRSIPIETASGRAEYAREQTAIAQQSQVLRTELLARCESLLAAHRQPDHP